MVFFSILIISRKVIIRNISLLFILLLTNTSIYAQKNTQTDVQTNALMPTEKILTLTSGIYAFEYERYEHYLADNVCQNLTPDFSKEQINRLIVDLLISCLAFKAEGVTLNLRIIPYPNNRRAMAMVKEGIIDTLVPAIWNEEIEFKYLYSSDPVVEKGEFEKGIYVYEHHPLLQMPLEKINLKNYRGISLESWKHDWRIINKLTPDVLNLGYLPSLFSMLRSGRADFTLMSFPSPRDLDLLDDGIRLKPIKGIKISINDTRRFIASKKSVLGKEYITILNRGLAKLAEKGIIHQVYSDSGFLNERVKNWQIIN